MPFSTLDLSENGLGEFDFDEQDLKEKSSKPTGNVGLRYPATDLLEEQLDVIAVHSNEHNDRTVLAKYEDHYFRITERGVMQVLEDNVEYVRRLVDLLLYDPDTGHLVDEIYIHDEEEWERVQELV